MDDEVGRRWRLVLGREAEDDNEQFLKASLGEEERALDEVLEFLFNREYDQDQQVYRDRRGNLSASQITVPQWLGRIRELFPRSTAESLARFALDRYGLAEILADKTILEKIQPNLELLRSLLSIKEIVPEQLLASVRSLIRRIVDELRTKIEFDVRRHFLGARHRRSQSPLKVSKNFDVATTLRRNLRHFRRDENRLVIERAYFHSRIVRHNPWSVILVVDQSGSMTDSVIHSAVLVGIFHGLPTLRTHLVIFDTEVVDMSEISADPVEVLMRTQLGGGTDIAQAMQYATTLVQNPSRTLIALITDFYEGGDPAELHGVIAKLKESGVTLLGLAAIDSRAEPAYDRETARDLAAVGMQIGAMTPDRFSEWVAERVRK